MKKAMPTIITIMVIALIGFGVYFLTKNSGKKTVDATTTGLSQADKVALLAVRSDDHVRGDSKAPVVIVEYADFQCPYCVRFDETMQQVMTAYPAQVRWVYRHFPLSFHQNAQQTAMAVEAAGKQDKFWEYADLLIKNSQGDGTGLNSADLTGYAQTLGLDTAKFALDQNDLSLSNRISSDQADGAKLGIQGTPASYLIDAKGNISDITGALPYDQMKLKIDAALAN